MKNSQGISGIELRRAMMVLDTRCALPFLLTISGALTLIMLILVQAGTGMTKGKIPEDQIMITLGVLAGSSSALMTGLLLLKRNIGAESIFDVVKIICKTDGRKAWDYIHDLAQKGVISIDHLSKKRDRLSGYLKYFALGFICAIVTGVVNSFGAEMDKTVMLTILGASFAGFVLTGYLVARVAWEISVLNGEMDNRISGGWMVGFTQEWPSKNEMKHPEEAQSS